MTFATDKKDIKDLTRDELASWLLDIGEKPYRLGQIYRWIYVRQVDSFDEMTNLGKPLREQLAGYFSIDRLIKEQVETSSDGSVKYLYGLKDGNHIETVLIPEKDHYTLCISSQIGCTRGCRFCLTAKGGFVRNLTIGEVTAQVRDVARDVGKDSLPLSNIVFMGMGEPLDNYDNVVGAIQIITDGDAGLGISGRRVTLSTAGVVPRLADLARDTHVNLAISLNAVDDETRSRLMPINRRFSLKALLEACTTYPLKPRRRITFEYILIRGVNDSVADAELLAEILRPIKSKINLIPYNENPGSDFQRPDDAHVHRFQDVLRRNNYTAIIRHSKGQDISAACGQLRAKLQMKNPKPLTESRQE
jgi:23S rRNA (adenine2503-C2)-methyltransferase